MRILTKAKYFVFTLESYSLFIIIHRWSKRIMDLYKTIFQLVFFFSPFSRSAIERPLKLNYNLDNCQNINLLYLFEQNLTLSINSRIWLSPKSLASSKYQYHLEPVEITIAIGRVHHNYNKYQLDLPKEAFLHQLVNINSYAWGIKIQVRLGNGRSTKFCIDPFQNSTY